MKKQSHGNLGEWKMMTQAVHFINRFH